MRLASRFGYANQIRRDRPLTHEELMHYVPGIFGEEKHTSRSQNYTYIPTITVLESLQREGFQPFFACQTRVRDPGRRGYTKHMLRLRRVGEINGEHVLKLFCSTLMTVPPATRCCRVTSGSSARTGASVASLWGKCVFHTGEM
ncbi:CP4-57 prophage protein [Escherichia coli]|nr:CP4-57 prophage protein [Escherichia coli]